jgi:hypothetical protein
MFSQDESDVVNRNRRGADDSDAGSMKSNDPTSVQTGGGPKEYLTGTKPRVSIFPNYILVIVLAMGKFLAFQAYM